MLELFALSPLLVKGTSGNDRLDGSKYSEKIYGFAGDDTLTDSNGGVNTLYGGDGNDKLTDVGGNSTLYGGKGNDTLQVTGVNPGRMYGEDGEDELQGGDGDDILSGGPGTDLLFGGQGHDTYLFNLGDGQDVINQSCTENDTGIVQFGSNITPSNIEALKSEQDLLLKLNSNDGIKIRGFFLTSHKCDEFKFKFENTSELTVLELFALSPLLVKGTSGNDRLDGSKYSEKIYGFAGDDTLTDSNGGVNTFYGGLGNDELRGGEGNDTYIFNLGDGKDIIFQDASENGRDAIEFGEGISSDRINFGFNKQKSDIILQIKDVQGNPTRDQITIYQGLANPKSHNLLGGLKFKDNSALSWDSLRTAAENGEEIIPVKDAVVPAIPTVRLEMVNPTNEFNKDYRVVWEAVENAFNYRLEVSFSGGRKWLEETTTIELSKEFLNPGPGEYIYRVRSCNSEGVCSEPSVEQNINIILPLGQCMIE